MQFSQRVGVNNGNDERVAGPLQLEFRTNRQIALLLSVSICSFPSTELAARPAALQHKTDVLHTLISITKKKKRKKSLAIYKEYKFGGSHISMPLSL